MEVNINDIANYRNCAKKLYSVYVCKPPQNTVVINKLEQADVIRTLNGKTFFTAEEIENMETTNPSKLRQIQQLVSQGRAYAVTDATPFVLCGTVGELCTISPFKLAKTYVLLHDGQPVPINSQTINSRLKGEYLDWTMVRTSAQATAGQNMACFVPRSQSGQIQTSWGAVLTYNGVGVSHGKGDFIVCAKLPNGKPNLADRWVVNGEIFATTYNNQGWAEHLNWQSNRSISIEQLPKLILEKTKEAPLDLKLFTNKVNTLIKELQWAYKFEVESCNGFKDIQDYTGIAQEFNIIGRCYVVKAVVRGTFSNIRSFRNRVTGDEGKIVYAERTSVWFAASAEHKDSAIVMSISPIIEGGNYLSGWVFPDNSSKVPRLSYYKCNVGTIGSMNCADEVSYFSDRCDDRDLFLKNKGQEYLNNIKPNGLFKKYTSTASSHYFRADWKFGTDFPLIGGEIIESYKEADFKGRQVTSTTTVAETYNMYVKSWASSSKSQASEKFIEVFATYLRCHEPVLFGSLSTETLYKDVISKAPHDTVFSVGVLTSKYLDNNMFSVRNFIYIPIEFTDSKNKKSCVIAKIASPDYFGNYRPFSFCYINESTTLVGNEDIFEAEFAWRDEIASFTNPEYETVAKDLMRRCYLLESIKYICLKIRVGWLTDYEILDSRKSFVWNAFKQCDMRGYTAQDYGFYTSDLQDLYKNKQMPINRSKYPDGDFIIAVRLFVYVFSSYARDSGNFFKLHPINDAEYDSACRIVYLSLVDGSCIGVSENEDGFQMYLRGSNGSTSKLRITKPMLDECYEIIDKCSKTKEDLPKTLVYEKLGHSKLYSQMELAVQRFLKPRKPSEVECRYALREVCNLFTNRITEYGINIVSPFREFSTSDLQSYNDIIVDGDNDNRLNLHFKTELSKENWGIHISGKTDKKVLNKTYMLVDSDASIKDKTSIASIIKELIEQDMIGYLGISKWKRFCTKMFITQTLPLNVIWTTPESEHRSRVVSFNCDVLHTQYKFRYTADELQILGKVKGIAQPFSETIKGDITELTLEEMVGKMINIALHGCADAMVRSAVVSLVEYKSFDSRYKYGGLLRFLKEIHENTLVFTNGNATMSSAVLPDESVMNAGTSLPSEYVQMNVRTFPKAIEMFASVSHRSDMH